MVVIIDDPAPIEEQFTQVMSQPSIWEIAAWSLRHYQISPFKEVQLSDNNQQALNGQTIQEGGKSNEPQRDSRKRAELGFRKTREINDVEVHGLSYDSR